MQQIGKIMVWQNFWLYLVHGSFAFRIINTQHGSGSYGLALLRRRAVPKRVQQKFGAFGAAYGQHHRRQRFFGRASEELVVGFEKELQHRRRVVLDGQLKETVAVVVATETQTGSFVIMKLL